MPERLSHGECRPQEIITPGMLTGKVCTAVPGSLSSARQYLPNPASMPRERSRQAEPVSPVVPSVPKLPERGKAAGLVQLLGARGAFQ